MLRGSRFHLPVVALVFAAFCGTAGADDYAIINLSSLLESPEGRASSVNASGVVVGDYRTGDGRRAGFIYHSQTDTLVTLPQPSANEDFVPNDINDSGTIVGRGISKDGTSGYIYRNGIYLHAPDSPKGASGGMLKALNNSGVVVGAWSLAGQDRAGTLSVRGLVGQPVAHPVQRSLQNNAQQELWMEDVNESGIAVGTSSVIRFSYPGFMMECRAMRADDAGIQDIGTLPGKTWSMATSINDAGKITGSAFNTGSDGFSVQDCEAFIFDGANRLGLGRLSQTKGSTGTHISNNDAVVGYCGTEEGAHIAFLYTPREGMRDLNNLLSDADREQWHLTDANSINDKGQIVGTGTFAGMPQAFLLNPISNVTEWSLLAE
ncbi:DUF3466 family protein [Candidatus Sumerlaeota bacterium]|nr:DUF3466 family protein [Candidatus Sumerlaeota bacterium]